MSMSYTCCSELKFADTIVVVSCLTRTHTFSWLPCLAVCQGLRVCEDLLILHLVDGILGVVPYAVGQNHQAQQL